MIFLLEQGGVLLYVLVGISFISIWITLQQAYILWINRIQSKQIASFYTIFNKTKNKKEYIQQMQELQLTSCLFEAFCVVLQMPKQPMDIIEDKLSFYIEENLSILSFHTYLLRFIMRISPQIGLLGTVVGMSIAFYKISGIHEAVTPMLLASGIWKALLTTIAGLLVSLLTAFFLFMIDHFIRKQRKIITKLANDFVTFYQELYA